MNIWRKIPSGILLFAIYTNAIVQLYYSDFSDALFATKSNTTHFSADLTFQDLLAKILIGDNLNKTKSTTNQHPKKVVSDLYARKSFELNCVKGFIRICNLFAHQIFYKSRVSKLLFPFHTFW